MTTRGRPALLMTKRRQQVLNEYQIMVAEGGKVRLAELARRCGLYSHNEARRTLEALRKMGHVG